MAQGEMERREGFSGSLPIHRDDRAERWIIDLSSQYQIGALTIV